MSTRSPKVSRSPRAHGKNDPSSAEYRAANELRASLRQFLQSSEQVLHACGLTPERYELLLAIKAASDGSERPSVGTLAEALGVAQSSVTQLVRRAEDAGLLCREVSNTDARVRYLRPTRMGERRLAAAVALLRPERARLAEIVAGLRDAVENGGRPEVRRSSGRDHRPWGASK